MVRFDLDANATTPLRPEVWDAMRPAMFEGYGNPSSAHSLGRKARQLLDDARDRVAALLGASPDEIAFTSGATEANNIALFGLARPGSTILASQLEHSCIIEPLKQLSTRGCAVEWLPVTADGIVEPAEFRREASIAILQLVNHETGAIQPVAVAVSQAKVPFHCDAAQAIGKIRVDVAELGITTLCLSAHKFGGPKGVGVLFAKRGAAPKPLMFGGHQQRGLRPGTEAVALVVGLARAFELVEAEREARFRSDVAKRDAFLRIIRSCCPTAILNSPAGAVPNALNMSFPGCRSEVLLMALDMAGIACSTGSACSSGSLLPSPVLMAMGVSAERLESAMRFSFPPSMTIEDIEAAAKRIVEVVAGMTRV